MASLHRPFDVLRVDIPPAQNDHVLEPAGDKEFAILQESQVAGSEERLVPDESGPNGIVGFRGSPPVARGNTRPRNPNLADAITGARLSSLGIDEHHAIFGGDHSTPGKPLALLGLTRV